MVAILGAGIGVVVNSADHLFQPGPSQDEFVSYLGSDLSNNVTPTIQNIAGQALTESQPAIQTQFVKLGTRVPDLSSAFAGQFDLLQKDLPQRGDDVVNATFGKVLTNLEPKIRATYPGVTDQAVDTLITNVSGEAQTQFAAANDRLFAKHEATLKGISADINTIRSTEPIGGDQDKANLDMAISVIESFHSDLSTLDSSSSSGSTNGVKNI